MTILDHAPLIAAYFAGLLSGVVLVLVTLWLANSILDAEDQ